MQVPAINSNQHTTFTHTMPTKKTYRAMKAYYELINDKSSAVEYGMLHREAMSRLHFNRFMKYDSKFMEMVENYPENASLGAKLKHIFGAAKYMNKATYEKIASWYYY